MCQTIASVVLLTMSLPALAAFKASMLNPTVSQVAAGGNHTCALTPAGPVECWGDNSLGQLGNDDASSGIVKIPVSNLTDAVALVAGNAHTCAVTLQGFVRCWGDNGLGQLGNGTNTNQSTPAATLIGGIAALAAGYSHTCALTATGLVICWLQRLRPARRRHEDEQERAGHRGDRPDRCGGHFGRHRAQLRPDAQGRGEGGVKCWGYNAYGQVGDGGTTNQALAVDVQGHISSAVAAIGTGASHTCVITTAGAPLCWGSAHFRQLGTGTSADAVFAATSVSVLLGVTQIAGGSEHTCALTVGGAVLCWGDNITGQVGDGTTVQRTTPAGVSGLGSGVASIATAHTGLHSCAVTTAGAAKCWGLNLYGQLGGWQQDAAERAVNVTGLASGVAAIAAGTSHTCSLSTAGAVQCWGRNDYGQLGDGTQTDHLTPAPVTGLGSGVVALTAGGKHTCALTTLGAVKCWGWNPHGQIAAGNLAWTTTPLTPTGLSGGIAHIAAGASHTCVVTTVGAMKCMGANARGQLGDATQADSNVPVDVYGPDSAIVAIEAGADHTCALSVAGTLHCWGDNADDQLGRDRNTVQYLVFANSLLRGRSIAFEPSARAGVGTSAYEETLYASGTDTPLHLEVWTPDTCSIVNSEVHYSSPGMCGVRVRQGTDSSLTLATPSRQTRLIQVESDLIFASGLDVWNGMKH